jgi:pyruvate/2-oxoglutarate dehydrogenase complex dihydrolipoamide dehydrogenase (E3) component
MKKYDVILIGTGQATGTILPSLLQQSLHVAVIERYKVGGSCVNWGCTPTKTLVASAKVARMIQRSAEFGIECPAYSVNFPNVMKGVNRSREESEKGFKSYLQEVTDFYAGVASFVDEHTIHIEKDESEEIFGKTIIIHTGAKATVPPIEGIKDVPYLTNRELFSLKELPKHLVIIGGSYIALEIGQIFKRFGSEVTMLERGERIIAREDQDISEGIHEVLEKEGISIQVDTAVKKVEQSKNGIIVTYTQHGKTKQVKGTHLLVATGRAAQTNDLHLENAHIETTPRGYIQVNEYCQTSLPHVYALGDVNGKGAFTHTSVHDGQIFLDHFFKRGKRTLQNRTMTYALYTDPPVGRVGINEQDALRTKKDVLVATMLMSNVSRAKEKKETQGKMKIVVDKQTKEILGATIFGVGGDELIGIIDVMIQGKLPYTVLQHTVIPHPTVGELIPFMFESLTELSK